MQRDQQKQLKPRQHTVSKFYLRRFAAPASKKGDPDGFWVYRRGEGTPKWLPWQSVTIHSHFYSYVDDAGVRNPEIEELLPAVESVVAPIVQRLPSVGVVGLNGTERGRLMFFIAAAYARTPSTRRRMVEFMEKRAASKVQKFASDDEGVRQSVEKFNAESGGTLTYGDAASFLDGIMSGDAALRLGDKGQLFVPLLGVVPLCEMLLGMTWRLAQAPAGRVFVTSDNPVILSNAEGDPDPIKSGQIEVTMPIDPRHCLVGTPSGPAFQAVYPSDPKWVDDVVRRTTVGADVEVYTPTKSVIVARYLSKR